MRAFIVATCLAVCASPALAQDYRLQTAAAAEFQQMCTADAGQLWNTTLCGPLLVVDANTRDPNVRAAAEGYLEFLYTREAQEIIARRYYRPFDAEVLAANAARFPNVPLVTVQDVFLSWHDAHQMHFRDGGVFDQIRSSQ